MKKGKTMNDKCYTKINNTHTRTTGAQSAITTPMLLLAAKRKRYIISISSIIENSNILESYCYHGGRTHAIDRLKCEHP